ncbi:MAG: response regulator [Bradymonadales bacterium]|nr:response regulator [Bradymonadales bacterium]
MAQVLVVDDVRGARTTLSRMLQEAGHGVQSAESVQDAIEKLKQHTFDVMVADIIMPESSGLELLRCSAEIAPGLKVILLTGVPSVDSAAEAIRAHAFDYLVKPVDQETLVRSVTAAARYKLIEDEDLQNRHHLENLVGEQTLLIQDYLLRLQRVAEQTEPLILCHDQDELASQTLELLARVTGASGGSVYLRRADQLHLVDSLDWGHQPRQIPVPPPTRSVLGKLFSQKEPIHSEDVSQQWDIEPTSWPGYINPSFIALPFLDASGEISGAITLHNKRTGPFTRQDLALGRIISAHATAGFQNLEFHQAQREADQRYRDLIDRSLTGVFIQQEYRLVYVNPRFLSMLGYSPQQSNLVVGQPFVQLVYPEDRDVISSPLVSRLKGEEPSPHIELRLVRNSGEVLHCELLVGRIEYNGRPALLGNLIDCSERKRAEEALKLSERRYRQLIENAPLGILTCDTQGVIQDVNPRLLDILGSPSAHQTREINCLAYPPMVEAGISADCLQCLQTGEPSQAERPYTSKWGKELFLRYHITPIRGDEEEITGMQAIVEDVSGTRRTVEEKLELERQLFHAQKMESIGRLAGGIAHDFKNLLTGIMGNIQLALLDIPPHAPQHDALVECHRSARRASELTNQLLTFSRRQIIQPTNLDLSDVIRRMSKILERLIGEDIQLALRLDPSLGLIHADQGQIEQILVNLVVNARDAMPAGGRLEIRTTSLTITPEVTPFDPSLQPGEYVVLSLTDTGIGMTEEVRSRIFEPFFTTKPSEKGTGLGLSTVYGIVRKHQGTIQVSSQLGKGSTFTVYLPTVEGDEERAISRAPFMDAMPTGSETILMVEDNPLVRDFNLKVLQRLEYNVLVAANGEEALRIAEEYGQTIDLLLTDVVMPGMSGRDLSLFLKQRQPRIKVLFVSGYTDEIIAQHGLEKGSETLLPKPYTPRDLAVQLRLLLDQEV